jgi:salicylate hydroxylase
MQAYHEPLGQCSVHRAVLLDTLVKHIPAECSHFGKRLVNIIQSPSLTNGTASAQPTNGHGKQKPVQLHFEDGTQAEADVVIGYDGIHSVTRKFLDGKKSGLEGGKKENENSKLVWSGTWAYRGERCGCIRR